MPTVRSKINKVEVGHEQHHETMLLRKYITLHHNCLVAGGYELSV